MTWDDGNTNSYRMGSEGGRFDLKLAHSYDPSPLDQVLSAATVRGGWGGWGVWGFGLAPTFLANALSVLQGIIVVGERQHT